MEETNNGGLVHRILARSYSFYFFSFLFGIILDFIFPMHLFAIPSGVYLGFLLMLMGTLFIFWAQKSSKDFVKDANMTGETFRHGPYRYTRNPTHLGIALVLIGFGILTDAFFVVVFTLIAAIITRFTFLRKEEAFLENKYGEPYREYKKLVKF